MFDKWVQNIQQNWFPIRTSKICSEHFLPEMFDRTGQIVRLRAGAEPTVFLLHYAMRHHPTIGTRSKAPKTSDVEVQTRIWKPVHSVDACEQQEKGSPQPEVIEEPKDGNCVDQQEQFQSISPMNFLTISNVMYLDPVTNRVSVIPVPSVNVMQIQQAVSNPNVASVASETTEATQAAEAAENINEDHNYITCSDVTNNTDISDDAEDKIPPGTLSVGIQTNDEDLPYETAGGLQHIPSAALSVGMQTTHTEHNYSTCSDMTNCTVVYVRNDKVPNSTAGNVHDVPRVALPVEKQTARAERSYSTHSNMISSAIGDSGPNDGVPNATACTVQDVPSTALSVEQQTTHHAEHSYSTSLDSRCNIVDSGLNANVQRISSNNLRSILKNNLHVNVTEHSNSTANDSSVTAPTAGEELRIPAELRVPAAVRVPRRPAVDHGYGRRSTETRASKTSHSDHLYVVTDSAAVLKARLEQSYARIATHRKQKKLLLQKVRRLEKRVKLLKDALRTARKNQPDAQLRVLLPRDNNT